MRKVFLEDLPKWRFGIGQIDGVIDWINSIGYKIKFIYDDIKGEIEIIDYKEEYLYIKYLDEPIIKIATGSFSKCRFGKLLNKITNEFKYIIEQNIKDNNRDMTIINREYRINNKSNGHIQNDKWYKYTCNKCGWTEGWIKEGNLNEGNGCGCCSGKVVVQEINSIVANNETHWMIKYFQGGYDEAKLYTKGSSKKIYPICTDCGRIKSKPITIAKIYNNHSIGCICSDKISYPNKFAYSLLDQLNEIYKFDYIEREYSPDWIKPKRYDNYFIHNGKEYILEMDGAWHNKDNTLSGKTKEESRSDDDKKDLNAKEHGIEVIRIECGKSELDYIKQNILSSRLNKFDLNIIDWSKCEQLALSNFVKQACEYWDNGIYSIKEICKTMKMSKTTITRYLKKGSKIWCNYDAKESHIKGSSKGGKALGKPVICIETGHIFKSLADTSRESEKEFGVKLEKSCISQVCLGKKKQYKGFTFKYINEIEQTI